MTTATAPAQGSTLYGPDGRPLSPTATRPAGEAARPSAQSGDWQPVTTHGNATVWEKPAPAPLPGPDVSAAHRGELAAKQARITELETRLAIEAAKDRRPTTPTTTPEPATPAAAAPAPKKSWFDKHGPNIAMYAAVGLSASGEYALATFAGFPRLIAVLLPIAMDVYVIQAMRRHRDVAAALILAVAANALDRLAEAGLFGVDTTGHATWWLIVAVVAIAPFIVWRVHRITETKTTKGSRRSRETTTKASGLAGAETGGLAADETTETGVQVSPRETRETTGLSRAETTRETETSSTETTETIRAETNLQRPEISETAPRETKAETRPRRSQNTRPARETTTQTVTAIGDRETETTLLLDLMKSRGGAQKVSLADAIAETGRPKATAAKRLSAARDLYTKSA